MQHKTGEESSYQDRVGQWMLECFNPEIAADRAERGHRFLEEALELAQAAGVTADEVTQLTAYVFARPVGDPASEVGNVVLTLASLATSLGADMSDEGENELSRVSTPLMMQKIRAKQASKPHRSPLPGIAGETPE